MGEEDERSHPTTQKGNASAFAGWHNIQQLLQEADRIRQLPPSNIKEVDQWRRNRLWQIDQRVREIYHMRRPK